MPKKKKGKKRAKKMVLPNNKAVVLITGPATTGKTFGLSNISDPKGIAYLNTDMKELSFYSPDIQQVPISDPNEVLDWITDIEESKKIHTGALDTITHLMSNFEANQMEDYSGYDGWNAYAKLYKKIIHNIKCGTKNYVVFTHEASVHDEDEDATTEVKAPLKGSVGKVGIESDFSIILSSKKLPVKKLKKHKNKLLNITKYEKEDGFKYVYATRVFKDTIGEKTRSPAGMWKREELYIDNNLEYVFQRIKDFYSGNL